MKTINQFTMFIIEKRVGNMLSNAEKAEIDMRCAIYLQSHSNSNSTKKPSISSFEEDGTIHYDNGMKIYLSLDEPKNNQSLGSETNFESNLSGNISDSDLYDDNLSEIVFDFVGNCNLDHFETGYNNDMDPSGVGLLVVGEAV